MAIGLTVALTGCGASMPDVKGLTAAQAEKTMVSAGFRVGNVIYDPAAQGAIGAVVSQNPSAGSHAAAGSPVILTVAGLAPVPTPNLAGLDMAGASAALQATGFRLGEVSRSYDASAVVDTVASQNPSAGVDAAPNSPVSIVMSQGRQPIAIPAVVGKTQTEAKALLEAAGFKAKFDNTESKAKKGSVVALNPKAGAMLAPGRTVTVSVSTGITLVVVPRSPAWRGYGGLESNIRTAFGAVGLRIRIKYIYTVLDSGKTVPNGVYAQSPAAGARVEKGTLVTVTIASEGGEY